MIWGCVFMKLPLLKFQHHFPKFSYDYALVFVFVSVLLLGPLCDNCISCFAAHKKPRPQSFCRKRAFNYLRRAALGTVTQEILLHVSSFPLPRGSEASSFLFFFILKQFFCFLSSLRGVRGFQARRTWQRGAVESWNLTHEEWPSVSLTHVIHSVFDVGCHSEALWVSATLLCGVQMLAWRKTHSENQMDAKAQLLSGLLLICVCIRWCDCDM